MSESVKEQIERVRLMSQGDPTWDLSDNDLAALRAVLAMRAWQPIATAPKDGTWILLRGESGYINRPYRVHVGHWDAEYRPHSPWQTSEADCFEDDGNPPTHWMELP